MAVKNWMFKLSCCLLALALASGCSGPLAALGDADADEAIESAAADPSFPSAAEAGIATGSL